MSITISPELQVFIRPLSVEERGQLEANLVAEGCRDALVIWKEEGILLDGHHRLQICAQHGLDYRLEAVSLPDLDAAKLWIIRHQYGRRNWTPYELSYNRGKEYEILKRQGKRTDLTFHQSEGKLPNTAQALAAHYKVGSATIERDAVYAKAIDTLVEVAGPAVRDALLSRETNVTQTEVKALAKIATRYPAKAKDVLAAAQGAKTPKQARQIVRQATGEVREQDAWMDRLAGDMMGEVRGLVLEPEDPAVEEPTAPTLTEHEQACLGPRTEKEPGSVAWCWQTIGLMQSRWVQRPRDDAGVQALVDELQQYEAWNVVPPEEPYGSLEVLLSEELGLASVGDMLQEALWNLEHLEAHYRATPQLFALHAEGYLALTEACLHFATLLAPAAPPAPAPGPAPVPAEAAPRLRDQVGTLKAAVFQMVQQLQPCTNAQVRHALGEERQVVFAALKSLVKQGTIVKAGETYRVGQSPEGSV